MGIVRPEYKHLSNTSILGEFDKRLHSLPVFIVCFLSSVKLAKDDPHSLLVFSGCVVYLISNVGATFLKWSFPE